MRGQEGRKKKFTEQKSHFCVMIIYQKEIKRVIRRNLVLHEYLLLLFPD